MAFEERQHQCAAAVLVEVAEDMSGARKVVHLGLAPEISQRGFDEPGLIGGPYFVAFADGNENRPREALDRNARTGANGGSVDDPCASRRPGRTPRSRRSRPVARGVGNFPAPRGRVGTRVRANFN